MTSAAPPAAPHQLCSLRLGYIPVGLLLSGSYRTSSYLHDRQQARQLPGCHGCLLEHLLNCVPHASVEHLAVNEYNDGMSIKPFCHTELTDSHQYACQLQQPSSNWCSLCHRPLASGICPACHPFTETKTAGLTCWHKWAVCLTYI
jgi:hypothetical protein